MGIELLLDFNNSKVRKLVFGNLTWRSCWNNASN